MKAFVDNWPLIVMAACAAIVAIRQVAQFVKLPSREQVAKLKEWLLYAVTMAERDYGGGTGKIKLRSVFDMFAERFPELAEKVTFERFSEYVDDALDDMRAMLKGNANAAALVDPGREEENAKE